MGYEHSSEPFVDELRYYYIVGDAELVLDILHVVMVCLQAHSVTSQSVGIVNDVGAARIHVAVTALIFDVVVDILIVLRRLVKYGVASFNFRLIFI